MKYNEFSGDYNQEIAFVLHLPDASRRELVLILILTDFLNLKNQFLLELSR